MVSFNQKKSIKYICIDLDTYFIRIHPFNSQMYGIGFYTRDYFENQQQISVPLGFKYGSKDGSQYYSAFNHIFLADPDTVLFFNGVPIITINENRSLKFQEKLKYQAVYQ